MSSVQLEVAEVFQRFLPAYQARYGIASHQHKAIWAITHCRTAALGGHVDGCTHCGHVRISYNSCGNRHCPKCQWQRQRAWLEARMSEVLPVAYYHVVFTLPQELNPFVCCNERLMYNLLFRCAWQALRDLCLDPKFLGAHVGMLAVLHTWGQNLCLHPHVHAIVPAGGLSDDGRQWINLPRDTFFIPVKALSALFRGKYMDRFKEAYRSGALQLEGKSLQWAKDGVAFQRFCSKLYDKAWVSYAKRPFGGPAQVLRYLGRYTHRVAISSSRLEQMTNEKVAFWYKDYRQEAQRKLLTLDGVEFLRRFIQHILPPGFAKIRYYGILANRGKQERVAHIRTLIGAPDQLRSTPDDLSPLPDINQCPCCGKKTMVMLGVIPGGPVRAPPQTSLISKSAPDYELAV